MSSGHAPCSVMHVWLDQEPRAIEAPAGDRSVLVIFWWKDLALGSRLLTAGELPVPALSVASVGANAVSPAVAARLGALPADGAAALDAMQADIRACAAQVAETMSVVVCTRDRPQALARCLTTLQRCSPPPDEIVVVDNAPGSAATREVCGTFPGVRYVTEPIPGLSRARNTGIEAATGSIIAFTDDDVEVSSSWIGGLKAGFLDETVACVTGLVLPVSLHSEAAFAFEMDYGGLGGSFLSRLFGPDFLDMTFGEAPQVWRIGAGANMAFRREAFEHVGLFDVRLGAGATGCSEDSEFWYRLLAAGYFCRYEPAAVVHHQHRDSISALRRQLRDYMRGHMVALLIQYQAHGHPGNLVRALTLPAWTLAAGLGHVFRSSFRRQVIAWELWGLAEGPFAWLRRRRQTRAGTMP